MRLLARASVAAALLFPAGAAISQGPPQGVGQPPPFTSFMQDLRDREYVPIRDNVLKTVVVLDEQKLEFKPVPAARTLREELEHLAATNFRLCGMAQMRMQGSTPVTAPPRDTTMRRSLGEVQSLLRSSFALCDQALDRIDDVRAREATIGPYMRYSHLQAMVTHAGHEYGKITVYLRLLGVVPPSSAR